MRQQGFSSAYLFGAVCPEREAGVALVLPEVSTAAMDVVLAEPGRLRSLTSFPWLPASVTTS